MKDYVMPKQAKICGINTRQSMQSALTHGADFVGLVFFPPSPRAVSPMMAAALASQVPENVKLVGLFVEPDDAWIDQVMQAFALDIIQLHGKETPARCADLKNRTGRAVMKAIGISNQDDLGGVSPYAAICDYLLFDAKPPKDATLPGGNARAFDWPLLAGQCWNIPWMLAGGLTLDNVETAVRITGAECVDISSGVENAPGQKSSQKIAAFLGKVKSL